MQFGKQFFLHQFLFREASLFNTFFFPLKTESYYVALAGLELAM